MIKAIEKIKTCSELLYNVKTAFVNNIVANRPDRDEILVESVFSPTILRAIGTQYSCFS